MIYRDNNGCPNMDDELLKHLKMDMVNTNRTTIT